MDTQNTAGPGEEKTHITRLEKEQDKASLAKELLDMAVPYVTVEGGTLDTNDLIDVFEDVMERLRSTLWPAYDPYQDREEDQTPF